MSGDSNATIAKNTLLLYARQLLIMIVTLYTSRVVLQALGVDDYGIFNVVGGVVTMFTFLMSTMASASQRYLAYDLASGDKKKLTETFGLTLLTYIILAIITVVLIEAIAIWFLNAKMNIPEDRLVAANWVLQFSILTFLANIFATPYLSVIIAHEEMNVYAYVSIIEVALKLIVVFLLALTAFDKLIVYSFLLFLCSVTITLSYIIYCFRKFGETRTKLFYDKNRLKEMTSFAWWNMIGSVANLLRSQGINILLNIFFTPAVNAARGIAYQVNGAITSFANNFYTAVKPQIIKNYASGNYENMRYLVLSSSRLAFYLVLFLSLPVFLNTQQILELWLGNPPYYTSLFIQLVLINALAEVFSMPLVAGLQATGNIKIFQLTVSIIYLLNVPISYFLLKQGLPPETTMYVNLALVAMSMLPRLVLCKKHYSLPLSKYIYDVLLRTWFVAFLCYGAGKFVVNYFNTPYTVKGLIISSMIVVLITIITIFGLGLSKFEREKLFSFIKTKVIRNF